MVAAPVNWGACALTCSHPSVIAGFPVSATLTLHDQYGNPSALQEDTAVTFEAWNTSRTGDVGRDLPFVSITKSRDNTFVAKVVPEIAGELKFVAIFQKDRPNRKEISCSVQSSKIDWLGRTFTEIPKSVTAGTPIECLVHLCDTFGNNVDDVDASRIEAVVSTGSGTQTIQLQKHPEFKHVVLLHLTPTVAGDLTITLRLQHVERSPMVVNVNADVYYPQSTVFHWHQAEVAAGVECCFDILFKDKHGNVSTNAPPVTSLKARLFSVIEAPAPRSPTTTVSNSSGSAAPPPADEGAVVRHLVPVDDVSLKLELNDKKVPQVLFTPTKAGTLRAELVIAEVTDGSQLLTPPVTITPSTPHWPNTIVHLAASTVTAGTANVITLTLRDRFLNEAHGIDAPSKLIIAVEKVETGAAVLPADVSLSITPSPKTPPKTEPSEWCVSLQPTFSAQYRVGLSVKDSDVTFSQSFAVIAADVSWPQHCKLSADTEVTVAGSAVFYTVESMDRYGNPTSRGISADSLKVSLDCKSVAGAVVSLPRLGIRTTAARRPLWLLVRTVRCGKGEGGGPP